MLVDFPERPKCRFILTSELMHQLIFKALELSLTAKELKKLVPDKKEK